MTASSMDIRDSYLEKIRGELEALVARGLVMGGAAFSPVLVLRGDVEGLGGARGPLTPDEEKALSACLTRLGYEPGAMASLLTRDAEGAPLSVDLLRTAVMALDPQTVIAADDGAARALRDILAPELVTMADLDQALLEPGDVVEVLGMRVMALGGLTTSESPKAAKGLMWKRLQKLPPLAAPY